MFIHTVFFWLKAEAPTEALDSLLHDARELLGAIPSVQKLFVGTPAQTPRGVVDNSYAVGLTVHFVDHTGHDLYQPHALHEQFIAQNQDHWERVVVYDYVE